jgi:hypothetical protein
MERVWDRGKSVLIFLTTEAFPKIYRLTYTEI